jgi:PQQ-like domain/Repeat of unknown function (DUF346)
MSRAPAGPEPSSRSGLLLRLTTVVAVIGISVPGSAAGASAVHTRPGVPPSAPVAGSGTWSTYHHDAARSGVADPGPDLTASRLVWQTPQLDGEVFAEPIVTGSTVIVATEHNVVYGLDAVSGGVLWQTGPLGPPASLSFIHSLQHAQCGDIDPLGITGTPVLDAATGEVFVVAEVAGVNSVSHELFGLDAATGHVLLGGVSVDAPNMVTDAEQQRAALALGNGRIYVSYGGLAGDCGPYHGWVVSVTESGASRVSYQVPTTREGGIWASSGPAIDAAGHVFVAVGNGAQTDPNGAYDGSDSVTELSATLGVLNLFKPPSWASDNAVDADLGSTGPELLSGNRLFQIGKSGTGYLLDSTNLGAVFSAGVCASFGGHAYLAPIVYVSCTDGVRAVRIRSDGSGFDVVWHGPRAASGPPVVGGNLVWDAGNDGFLYGLNPNTGGVIARIPMGSIEHFTTPTVAAGKVFVATNTTVQAFAPGGWSNWAVQPGPPNGAVGAPAVSSWGPGRLDLFVRGGDNALWHSFQTPGGAFSPWESLGGALTSAPSAASWARGRVDVFARGADGALWHKFWDQRAWSGWELLGGELSSSPAVVSWSAGRLDVVVRGADKAVWHKWWSGSGWFGWESLGGVCLGDPGADSWGFNALDVFCLGGTSSSGMLWHRPWRGEWYGWTQDVTGTWMGGVSAASWGFNRVDVFGLVPSSGALGHDWWDGVAWHGEVLDGAPASTPAATSWGFNRIDVFVMGIDDALHHKFWD